VLPAIAVIAALAAAPIYTPRHHPKAQHESAAAAGAALSDAEVRQRVEAYLRSLDTPVTAEAWRVLGARAVPLLEQVLASSDQLPSRRAKAVAGLGAIGGERAQALVLGAARSEAEPFAVRAAALHAAPELLGPRQLMDQLKPVLEGSPDPAVRAAAADALARAAPSEACAAVRAQAGRERQRSSFHRALNRCQEEAP
jgi:HEAT repeat protein